jgi:hypothetical protein
MESELIKKSIFSFTFIFSNVFDFSLLILTMIRMGNISKDIIIYIGYVITLLLLCYILYHRQKRIYKYVYYTDINVSLIYCNKTNLFIISLPFISNLFYIILSIKSNISFIIFEYFCISFSYLIMIKEFIYLYKINKTYQYLLSENTFV